MAGPNRQSTGRSSASSASSSYFAEIGHERNGVFFPHA
jgi:hypothetical protein